MRLCWFTRRHANGQRRPGNLRQRPVLQHDDPTQKRKLHSRRYLAVSVTSVFHEIDEDAPIGMMTSARNSVGELYTSIYTENSLPCFASPLALVQFQITAGGQLVAFPFCVSMHFSSFLCCAATSVSTNHILGDSSSIDKVSSSRPLAVRLSLSVNLKMRRQIYSFSYTCQKTGSYSSTRVQALFNTYQDKDDPGNIGAENFGQLCADANIPMEGAMPLILFWQLGSAEFGNIKREEWTKGMELLKWVFSSVFEFRC
jgi:hypothetical protein